MGSAHVLLLGDAGAEPLPGRGELASSDSSKWSRKRCADACEVRRTRLQEPRASGVRETCVENAPVSGTRLAGDEAGLLEAIDEARDPALAQEHRFGEIAHPQPLVRGVPEVQEHLVVGERQPCASSSSRSRSRRSAAWTRRKPRQAASSQSVSWIAEDNCIRKYSSGFYDVHRGLPMMS